MLVDSALSPSPFYNPTNDYSGGDMSDFINMDLFASQPPPPPVILPSSSSASAPGPASSSSRASSRSPAPSDTLATPPQPFIADPDPFASDFFNFSGAFADEFASPSSLTAAAGVKHAPFAVPMPISGAPFDFLAAFASPDSVSDGSQFAIDPQLVHTPSSSSDITSAVATTTTSTANATKQSSAMSSPADDGAAHEGDDEDEQDALSPLSPSALAPPLKAGGKGKSRRGTVQSGGIVKKGAVVSAVVKIKDDVDDDMDDWRPSPEEYKKMSSKEKRQLRNKISARNFRVRRKEYITTLEGDIAERDRLIDAIRSELGSTKSENAALREEISALKKALLTAPDAPLLPPPGPLPLPSPRLTPMPVASSNSNTSAASLLTANTQKDLGAGAGAAKAFWAGGAGLGAFGGGVTPVHTTIIPDLARPLASVNASVKPAVQENINPSLNINPALNTGAGAHAGAAAGVSQALGFGAGRPAPFDAFADSNPFTMKMLDAYRMQLWTRMAQQNRLQAQLSQQQQQQQQQSQQQQGQQQLSGLAANMRPAFFTTPKSPTISALLAGKHASSSSSSSSPASAPERAYPTPPASPRLSPKLPASLSSFASSSSSSPSSSSLSAASIRTDHAVLAAMAQQTLFQRLGSAFWDAFAGQAVGAGSGAGGAGGMGGVGGKHAPAFDADKVRRVLEGSAVVRVVDVDEPAVSASSSVPASIPAAATRSVRSAPASPRLAPVSPRLVPTSPRLAPTVVGAGAHKKDECVSALQSALEESMRALTLGKK